MSTPPRQRKRPIAVTLVGVFALVAFFIYGITGALDLWNSGEIQSGFTRPLYEGTALTETGVLFLGGTYFVLSSIAALIIGWGAFRMRRWAWIAFMAWCIFILLNQIVRYFAGSPGYIAMALAVFIVLALNQAEVQVAFGIKPAENVELESASNNSLDRE